MQDKKRKTKSPEENSLIVFLGRKKKKTVNSALQKTEYSSKDHKQKASSGKPAKKQAAKKSVKNLKSSSHTAQRIDRERQKIRQERLKARKTELFRIRLIIGAIALIVLLLIVLLVACPGKKQKTDAVEAVSSSMESAGTVETDTSEVRHFSFRELISDDMAGDNSILTVSQFRQILQQLYDSNYILVDFYSIAGIQQNEDGGSTYTTAKLDLPDGKIPFILSERDVSYSLDRIGKGYASRLIVTDDGQLTNEYQQSDGTVLTGSYDVATILEEFIAEHPDFAYENARGILGLTGYNGILGYRTSELLGKTAEEGNSYAVYGIFDVNAEIEACKPVVQALKDKGWHFASYGYNYCSYGAEYDMMTADVNSWMAEVSNLIGGTDLMMFPCDTDIGNWSPYTDDNQRYTYLKNLGFNYFCIEDAANLYWLQIRSDYVRQGIKEIDCYEDFEQIMNQ